MIPKTHISRVSELPAEFAAATGEAISKVADALTKGTWPPCAKWQSTDVTLSA